jgi:hypothetical protein
MRAVHGRREKERERGSWAMFLHELIELKRSGVLWRKARHQDGAQQLADQHRVSKPR